MPLNHAQVAAQRGQVAIPFGEAGTLNVTFNPAVITPRFQEETLASAADEVAGVTQAKFVAAAVVEWDYLDAKNKPFPLTLEVLKTLPVQVLDRVMGEVLASLRPPPKPQDSSSSF